MGEAATAKVRRWVRLFPDDVVENTVSKLKHCQAHTEVYMESTRHPDCSRWLQNSIAFTKPCFIELMVKFDALTSIPFPFIYCDPFASNTSHSII